MRRTRSTALRGLVVSAVGVGALAAGSVASVASAIPNYTDQAFDSTVTPTSLSSQVMLPGDEMSETFSAQAGGTLTNVHLTLASYELGSDLRVRIANPATWPNPASVMASKTVTVGSKTPVVDLSSSGLSLSKGTRYVLALDSFTGSVSVRTTKPDGAGGEGAKFLDVLYDQWVPITGRGILAAIDVTGTDNDAPMVTATVLPVGPDGSAGWYVTRPTVSYVCADTTTRVVDCPSGGSVADGVKGFSPSVTDLAGNVGTAAPFTLSVDTVAPGVAVAWGREPNAYGWYRRSVAYDASCSDATSGVVSCPVAGTVAESGDLVLEAVDEAGNSRQRTESVKIDGKPPWVRIPGLEPRETFRSLPTFGCRAGDGVGSGASGVRTCTTRTERLGSHRYRAVAVAVDRAGNRASQRTLFFVR